NVVAEIAHATRLFPRVKEYFFDDDTFTDDLPRAEAIARGLGRLGVTWSCNAKPDVPVASLRILRDNGLRLLLVGYESGSQAIRTCRAPRSSARSRRSTGASTSGRARSSPSAVRCCATARS